jgi:hypothetical protein
LEVVVLRGPLELVLDHLVAQMNSQAAKRQPTRPLSRVAASFRTRKHKHGSVRVFFCAFEETLCLVVPAKDPPKVEKTETKAFHSKWQICGKMMNSEFVPRKKKSNTRAFFLSFFFCSLKSNGGVCGVRVLKK